MKFLVVGDLHIKNDNFDEIDMVFSDIKKITEETQIDIIVLLGDILHWHEKIFTQSLNRALDFIKKCTDITYTYVLVGNHDAQSNHEFLTENHWMNAMKLWDNLRIVDTVVDEGEFMLCPYVFPGRFIEALDTHPLGDWKNKKLIFAHQEFRNCQMSDVIKSVSGDEWKDTYPLVVSGHIHDSQWIGENIYYTGAPLQHNSWDSVKRTVCSIEINEKDLNPPKIIEYSLNVPKKYVIKTDLKNLKDVKTDAVGKIKIKLSSTKEEFKNFKETSEYKDILSKGIKIQHIPTESATIENPSVAPQSNANFLHILENLVGEEQDFLVKDVYHEFFKGY
jgi:DNA repair exonuclease SbcCD nuclease subunit